MKDLKRILEKPADQRTREELEFLASELQRQSDELEANTKRGKVTGIYLNGKPISEELKKKLFKKIDFPDHMKEMVKSGISIRPKKVAKIQIISAPETAPNFKKIDL